VHTLKAKRIYSIAEVKTLPDAVECSDFILCNNPQFNVVKYF